LPTVSELANQELAKRYSLAGRTQLAPRVQTMRAAEPSMRSSLSEFLRDTVDATGLGGGYRQGLLNALSAVETAVDFLPVVGDALAVEDAAQAYGQGDMVGAGINMMGVVPVVGDVAAKGAKSALRGLDMNPEARMQRAQDLGFEEDIYYKGMYPYDYTKESGDYRGPEITEINRPEPFPAFNKGEEGVDIAGFLTKDREVANRFAGSSGGGAVYPLRYRRGKVYTIDANGRNAGDLQFGESGQEFRDAVRSGNYDTIEIINTADEGDITISTKPENIRSINAEFDPTKSDSADLLSSVGATSALRGMV